MSMTEIKKALLEEDYCEAMSLIGYKVLSFDEEGVEVIFTNDTKTNLVYFEVEEKEFWTYSRANHGVLADKSVKETK